MQQTSPHSIVNLEFEAILLPQPPDHHSHPKQLLPWDWQMILVPKFFLPAVIPAPMARNCLPSLHSFRVSLQWLWGLRYPVGPVTAIAPHSVTSLRLLPFQ